MEIIKNILTKNACYTRGVKIKPIQIMLHSTAVKGAPAKNFLRSWNTAYPNNKSVCVHAFVDPGKVYQTLPWNMRAWHCGGNGNNYAIGFEICEPSDYNDKEYFLEIKKTALELCVYLCKEFNLKAEDVTSHCEACRRYGKAYASNHSDLDHWWKKYFDYTMDNFRDELEDMLERDEEYMYKYETLEDVPTWGRDSIEKAQKKGILKGTGKGLGLTETEIKVLVWMDRAKMFE